ncbi:MAG: diacylglycerol kinase family protein [Patescibacteria group bacterium]|nr:diacylglycerol kinase family protein [Patescibacteria group bacterium]
MSAFTKAFVIFNPNSTGDSKTIAETFCQQLRELQPACNVTLTETTHAGHGEELGYELAKKGKDTLLVSVSGDGGYNELVNGVMKAVDEGSEAPICAVLPGGNANDHYSFIAKRPLIDAIAAEGLTRLDLLKVEASATRYAHSYVGLGLTPLVAVELNKHKLSAIKELWLSLKTFWQFKPFKIVESGKQRTFDSLIMANIGVMAKHLTLDPDAGPPKDGLFEVLRWPHNHKLRLVQQLAKAAIGKTNSPKSVEKFEFTTVLPMPMQLDGELQKLKADQPVTVTSAAGTLRTYR